MNKKDFIPYIALLSIIGCFFLYYMQKAEKPKTDLYETIHPTKKTVIQYVQASGTLEAEETMNVGSLVAGRVIALHADENDHVKKGDKLVTLDDGIGTDNIKKAEAILAQRQVEFTFQEKNFKRKKALFETGNLSEEAFDEATRAVSLAREFVAQADAELLLAQRTYANKTITAPTDGVIIARNIEIGQMITSVLNATTLFIIASDLTKMQGKLNIDEAEIGKVKQQAPVSFFVDSFPTNEFTSQITKVTYKSKNINDVVSFTAELLIDNSQLLLRPGMTINADIEVDKNEQTLSIPLKALRFSAQTIETLAKKLNFQHHPLAEKETRTQRNSVWILQDKTFIEKIIKTGAQNRQNIAVLEGLSENDAVLINITETLENPLVTQLTKGKIGG
jgi:HlyD family secretion protein